MLFDGYNMRTSSTDYETTLRVWLAMKGYYIGNVIYMRNYSQIINKIVCHQKDMLSGHGVFYINGMQLYDTDKRIFNDKIKVRTNDKFEIIHEAYKTYFIFNTLYAAELSNNGTFIMYHTPTIPAKLIRDPFRDEIYQLYPRHKVMLKSELVSEQNRKYVYEEFKRRFYSKLEEMFEFIEDNYLDIGNTDIVDNNL